MRFCAPWLTLVVACSYTPPGFVSDGEPDDAAIDMPTDATDVDAEIDAPPIDAAPFVCTTNGLDCNGGNSRDLTSCATPGECWVGCRDGAQVTPDQAVAICQAWGGRLGSIHSDGEETCIRDPALLNGSIILGMRQDPGQAADDIGWKTSDGADLAFDRWDTGQPNDADGSEDDQEQCAFSNSSQARWHDTPCDTVASARWTCRYP